MPPPVAYGSSRGRDWIQAAAGLTTALGKGLNLHLQSNLSHCSWNLNPLHHSGNSTRNFIFIIMPGAQIWIIFLQLLLRGTFLLLIFPLRVKFLQLLPSCQHQHRNLLVQCSVPWVGLLCFICLNPCHQACVLHRKGWFGKFPLKSLPCPFLPEMNSSTFRSFLSD